MLVCMTQNAKKLMFELANCLNSIHTRSKNEALLYDCKSVAPGSALDLLGTESVTNSSRSFKRLNSAHSGHSGI